MKSMLFIVLVVFLLYSMFFTSNFICFAGLFTFPKDRYDFIVCQEINISEKGKSRSFDFKNRYKGSYTVGILLGKKFDWKTDGFDYKPKLAMELNFYINDTLLTTYRDSKPSRCSRKEGDGFIYFWYNCPKSLPRNKLITCEITIVESDTYLSEKYGPIKFTIEKESDE